MDLAKLAYAAALGDLGGVAHLMEASRSLATNSNLVYCNRFETEMTLRMQQLCGTISLEEAEYWRKWIRDPFKTFVDAVSDADDPLPMAMDATRQFANAFRHPRAFIRQYGMTR